MVPERPSNMLLNLRDGYAESVVRAATPRKKSQIRLATSHSDSILTPGQSVLL